MNTRRDFLKKSLTTCIALNGVQAFKPARLLATNGMIKDDISLAQWALVDEIREGKWKTLDFPRIAREEFDINGIEFTNTLEVDAHEYFRGIESLRVSSHLLIDRQGDITQYVPFPKRAWHAGESSLGGRGACNDFSIGIELEGCDDQAYEETQYRRLAEVVAALQGRWPGIHRDRIVGHCDVAPGRKSDPGPAFDWEYFFRLLD